MNWEILNGLLLLIAFSVFVCLQAVFINGVHESFKGSCLENDIKNGRICQGMIFYPVAQYLEKHINKQWILKPIYKCVRCMASLWGAITYWPVSISIFGFTGWQIPAFVIDVFILVYLNYYFYKK